MAKLTQYGIEYNQNPGSNVIQQRSAPNYRITTVVGPSTFYQHQVLNAGVKRIRLTMVGGGGCGGDTTGPAPSFTSGSGGGAGCTIIMDAPGQYWSEFFWGPRGPNYNFIVGGGGYDPTGTRNLPTGYNNAIAGGGRTGWESLPGITQMTLQAVGGQGAESMWPGGPLSVPTNLPRPGFGGLSQGARPPSPVAIGGPLIVSIRNGQPGHIGVPWAGGRGGSVQGFGVGGQSRGYNTQSSAPLPTTNPGFGGPGSGYGAGGGGAQRTGPMTTDTGGLGAPGVLIVEEFY
jgi:hypothetical protein